MQRNPIVLLVSLVLLGVLVLVCLGPDTLQCRMEMGCSTQLSNASVFHGFTVPLMVLLATMLFLSDETLICWFKTACRTSRNRVYDYVPFELSLYSTNRVFRL